MKVLILGNTDGSEDQLEKAKELCFKYSHIPVTEDSILVGDLSEELSLLKVIHELSSITTTGLKQIPTYIGIIVLPSALREDIGFHSRVISLSHNLGIGSYILDYAEEALFNA